MTGGLHHDRGQAGALLLDDLGQRIDLVVVERQGCAGQLRRHAIGRQARQEVFLQAHRRRAGWLVGRQVPVVPAVVAAETRSRPGRCWARAMRTAIAMASPPVRPNRTLPAQG